MTRRRHLGHRSGQGTLLRAKGTAVAEVDYQLQISQDMIDTGREVLAGFYEHRGTFAVRGHDEPEIREGEELRLQTDEGLDLGVVVQSYSWGEGQFQLTTEGRKALLESGQVRP